MGLKTGEGDIGKFIAQQSMLCGAKKISQSGLLGVLGKWRYSEDEHGVVIRLAKNRFKDVQMILRHLFGEPTSPLIEAENGHSVGHYRFAAKGGGIQYSRDTKKTQIVIIGAKSKKSPPQPRKQTDLELQRYAAKLLFQFRVMVDGKPQARRLCEERIILIEALDGKAALKEAKQRGRAARHRYKNKAGSSIIFEFVGVMDLLCLGNECEDGEVWYDITERLRPMERRNQILPKETELNAIRNNF